MHDAQPWCQKVKKNTTVGISFIVNSTASEEYICLLRGCSLALARNPSKNEHEGEYML